MQGVVVSCAMWYKKPKYVYARTWEVMQLKTTSYKRCFIDMNLYNNFHNETKADARICGCFCNMVQQNQNM